MMNYGLELGYPQPYLLVFTPSLFLWRKTVTDFLDTRSEVLSWYAAFSNGILIISQHSAQDLGELFRQRFPGVLFIITLIPAGYSDGWLPQQAWDFINNPTSSGRWQLHIPGNEG